ncbi:MAG: hypothetical protein IJQ12_06555 [Lachnospiraceae bacterium]|nr:hypothetical protein [Lachnospiraceae bacterium]
MSESVTIKQDGQTLPLPDTPYFRCRQRHLAPQAKKELQAALSGGEGSFLIHRYLNYGRIAEDAISFSVSWLAQKARSTRGDVLKNLREMRALGLFPQSAIDDSYGFVYLSTEARNDRFVEYTIDARGYEVVRPGDYYRKLLREKDSASADAFVTEKDAATAPANAGVTTNDAATVPANAGVTAKNAGTPASASAVAIKAADDRAATKSVHRFTNLVRAYNDALPDKEISDALDETEELLVLVADTVGNMPAQDHKLNVVTTRYLPPLEKLLKSYQRLYRFGNASRKAERIRAQIIDAVHLFNHALRQLTEDLLSDAEFEINSDISMLKMMLERDGLLGTPFQ